jgi:hypothetical protein
MVIAGGLRSQALRSELDAYQLSATAGSPRLNEDYSFNLVASDIAPSSETPPVVM